MFNLRVCGIAASAAFVISLLLGLISRSSFPAFIVRPVIFAFVFFILSALINVIINHYLPELQDSGTPDSTQTEKFTMPGEYLNISEEDLPDLGAMPGVVPVLNAAIADGSEENLGDIASIDDEPSGMVQISGPSSGQTPDGEAPVFKTENFEAGGLDQKAEGGYTVEGGLEGFTTDFDAFTGIEAPKKQSSASASAAFDAAEFGGNSSSSAGASATDLRTEDFGSMDILPDLDGLAKAFSPGSGGESQSFKEGMGETDDYSASPVRKSSAGGKAQKLDWDFNPKDMAAGIRTKISKEG